MPCVTSICTGTVVLVVLSLLQFGASSLHNEQASCVDQDVKTCALAQASQKISSTNSSLGHGVFPSSNRARRLTGQECVACADSSLIASADDPQHDGGPDSGNS